MQSSKGIKELGPVEPLQKIDSDVSLTDWGDATVRSFLFFFSGDSLGNAKIKEMARRALPNTILLSLISRAG